MQIKGSLAILLGMVLILAINPRMIYSIYDTILGRLVLIGIVLFLSMNSTTLGLLATLVIIISLNQFSTFVEGMENATTIGEDNVPNTGNIKVLTKSAVKNDIEQTDKGTTDKGTTDKGQTISELKEAAAAGVDREDIKMAIAPKSEKAFPQPTSGSTENTMPATEATLKKNGSLTETFSTLTGY
jgi:hypothetical protein